MRDLKLIIEGRWWDSLLYKGQLHLFGTDGSLAVYAWESLIEDLGQSLGSSGMALRLAFAESNAIYRSTLNLEDARVGFNELDRTSFEISAKKLQEYCLGHTDNDFPFPHNSSAFHYDRLIVATTRGLFGAHFDPDTQVRAEAVRLSPVGSNQAWPAYGNAAVAAGTDGLFQVDLKIRDREWPPEQEGDLLSERACDACDWMFSNIIGTSFDEGSVLARFTQSPRRGSYATYLEASVTTDEGEDAPETERRAGKVDELEVLLGNQFDNAGVRPFTWGSRDKLYKVEGKNLAVFRLLSDGRTPFIGKVPLPASLENLVSVRTSLFGLVFEFDEHLMVLTSDGHSHKISGEPVNWRVFPRSRRYENHLHILRNDSLEVISYNQDIEQDQFEKLIGTRVPMNWID